MTHSTDPHAAAFYRYDHPSVYPDILNDVAFRKRDRAPGGFVSLPTLQLTDGHSFVWPDASDTRPMLLIFGSLTCPVPERAAPGLMQLHRTFGKDFRLLLVNVREAHPGLRAPQPRVSAVKPRNAQELKSHHRIPFEAATEDIDGAAHRALGGRPNSAHLISATGHILMRVQWANETAAIGKDPTRPPRPPCLKVGGKGVCKSWGTSLWPRSGEETANAPQRGESDSMAAWPNDCFHLVAGHPSTCRTVDGVL